MQGNRLALSGLEVAYIFHGIAEAPRSVIAEKMLPEIDSLISGLQKFEDKDEKAKEREYSNGNGGYWDDYCLALFLRGVCLRYVAYPVSTSVLTSGYTRGLTLHRIPTPKSIPTKSSTSRKKWLNAWQGKHSAWYSNMGRRFSWTTTWFIMPVCTPPSFVEIVSNPW